MRIKNNYKTTSALLSVSLAFGANCVYASGFELNGVERNVNVFKKTA